ncbi:AsmA-like C-terminal region-containing protein [Epilithonimonas zeae]|uniref:AsmA-like C-terminal region-containing protein n=1 Tax=Epilithonimonas zeae TaxID=1416779 RepID=UPI00200DC219|nr:AsmA-like C-terminal region-containing protein [Epilithonimonas zeae]UQB68730.1 hypothetical protein KI430_17240 [Epilithonimonas zeae]
MTKNDLDASITSIEKSDNKNILTSILKKAGKIIGVLLVLFIGILFLIPVVFKKQINQSVKDLINQNINGKLNYQSVNISFFKDFPNLTASLNKVDLKGSSPFQKQSLIKSESFSLGIDVLSLFSDETVIEGVYLKNGAIAIEVDSLGRANYNVYKSSEEKEQSDGNSKVKIKLIQLDNVDLSYNDASLPMKITLDSLNYTGKGDLANSVFDLETTADIKALTFSYAGETYVDHKQVHANLITNINTDNLAFQFRKNDLKINELPVSFEGKLAFLTNGYNMDFKLKTAKSTLANALSLVPKSYEHWLKNTEIKGDVSAIASLSGNYIVEKKEMPTFSFGLKIKDGYLNYNHSKAPLENLNLMFKLDFPNLDFTKLITDVRKAEFKLGNGYFKSVSHIEGFNPMKVVSDTDCNLVLEDLQKTLGLEGTVLKGNFSLKGNVNGIFSTKETYSPFNKARKTFEITSIPVFHITSNLKNGYLKLKDLPQAIDYASFQLTSESRDSNYKNIETSLKQIDIKSLKNYIKGDIHLRGIKTFDLDANAKMFVDLSEIEKIYPMKDLVVKGILDADINTKGKLNLEKKIIPVVNSHINLKNGYLKTANSPVPVENMRIEALVQSKNGSLQDLVVKLLPVSFTVKGQPFNLKADLKNFNNIKYHVQSKGKLELAPFYELFALDGLNVDGSVYTNFDIAGLQSDAVSGRYNRLKNRGYVEIQKINIKYNLLPKLVRINRGKMIFEKEKLSFDNFKANYGLNHFSANGYLDNIISYITGNQTVKGNFSINSPMLNIGDFTALANSSSTQTASPTAMTGVVELPKNIDISLNAKADKIKYNDLLLTQFKGNVNLKDGKAYLNNTGFNLAGMDAKVVGYYKPINTKRAGFDIQLKADNFDIQRAYKEIPLFREMMSAGKSAYGTISLDYQLGGLLNQGMEPIMNSLIGGGNLTLEDIKFKGFKILNQIAKDTDKDKLTDTSVNKIVVKSSIKNNVITIPRTKTKVAGFRPRFEGKVNLDGKLDLQIRLGLPPFGLFGIPISVSGTSDNPIIKAGKNQQKDDDFESSLDDEDKDLYEKQKAEEEEKAKAIKDSISNPSK